VELDCGFRHFLAGRCLFLAGLHFFQLGIHLFLMYVCLGFHIFLSGLCPGLVDIHLGDESTSKDLKLLIIGVYLGFELGF
jgi:hypothetical protein